MKIICKPIIIRSTGKINELNGISAPILKPFVLDIVTIYKLIVNGHDVYEIRQDGCEIKLTIDNYNKGEVIITPGDDDMQCGIGYVHPNVDGYRHLPRIGTHNGGKVLITTDNTGEAIWKDISIIDIKDFPNMDDYSKTSHTHKLATVELDGMMSKEDKKIIEKIDETFEKMVVDNIEDIILYINKANSKISMDSISNKQNDSLTKVLTDIYDQTRVKYFNFCINNTFTNGKQPLKLFVPFDCKVSNINVTIDSPKAKDLHFKIMVNDNDKYIPLHENDLIIEAGKTFINNAIIINEHINKGLYLVIDIISTIDNGIGLNAVVEVTKDKVYNI